jgi:hypothetical protein
MPEHILRAYKDCQHTGYNAAQDMLLVTGTSDLCSLRRQHPFHTVHLQAGWSQSKAANPSIVKCLQPSDKSLDESWHNSLIAYSKGTQALA